MRNFGELTRPFLFRFLPLAAGFLALLSVLVYQDMSNRENLYKDGERLKLEYIATSISLEMGMLFQDLNDLLHRRTLVHYLEHPTVATLNEVKQSYLLFSQDNPQYDQLRLLTKEGQEILRINAKDGQSWAVPGNELQIKSDRYYFRDSAKLKPGEVYTSPLDLNIEFGKLEEPRKPMLRIAAPVRDASGEVQGVLILNYLGDVLLQKLHNRLEFADQTIMLLDQNGYWLYGGGEDDWAFMFPDRKKRTFAARFPALWQKMAASSAGQFVTGQGLFTYATIVLSPEMLPGPTAAKTTVPLAFRQTWRLVSLTAPEVLAAVRWKEWPLYLAGGCLVLVLTGLGAYLHTSRMVERRIAQQALGISEARFRGLVETSPDMIWETDPAGNFTYVSPRAKDLLGWAPENLLGTTRCGFASPPGTGPDSTASGLAPVTWETACQGEGGLEKVLEISCVPRLDKNGLSHGWRGVARDITERKNAQRQLDVARQEAEQANRAKSEFLARMSHEIRTPLNAVIGMSHLALKTDLTAKQYDYVSKIRLSADALLAVINDILDFSKIEAGRLTIEHIPFDLDAVLGGVVDITSLAAEEKQLEFLLSVGEDVPSGLVGDPLRLGQVLLNLVNNAIKFTASGEVLLGVQVESRNDAQARVRFFVRDTGIGLSPEQQVGLFTPFAQADGSITRRYGGTGLGLSICQRLVELMGGKLTVQSRLGQGSEFSFCLDLPLSAAARERCLDGGANLKGLGVLVVDDNATSRQILSDILLSMQFAVMTADSGEEALRILENGEADIRVVLLDWKMPGLDGATCARRILAMPLSAPPAIIMVTAYGREEVRREAENVGVQGFLLKPVGRSVLFNTIAAAVGQSSGGESSCRVEQTDEQALPAGLRGKRVLVVEDNEINQQVARELLEGAGCSVTVAGDGAQALRVLDTAEPFAAVLMDVQMPVLDGLEATRRIREQPRFAALPIIAMTAHAMTQDREKSLAAGMNDHVNKPIDPRELLDALVRWLPQEDREAAVAAPPVEPPPATATAPALRLDSRLGLERLRGNKLLYRKLLEDFRQKYAQTAAQVRERLAAGDLPGARRLVHAFKGVAGNLGAMALYAAALAVETCLDASPPQGCETPLGQLDGESGATWEEISRFLALVAQASPASQNGVLLSPEEVPGVLEELLGLLRQNDTRALEVLERLAPAGRRVDPELVDALTAALTRLDFREAKQYAKKLQERLVQAHG